MHGRLKVKTTAEQQEAKRKERDRKLKLYNAGVALAFKKRKEEIYDEEGLKVTGEILAANPDFYTLWNFRREILSHLKEEWSEEDIIQSFENELSFLKQCLMVNPKSYGTWHHRGWVLANSPRPDWQKELTLCNRFLDYDERNFHCWDHRRFVVKSSGVALNEELDFTTSQISSNFSNFSSWHYRSKLLPVVQGDPDHPIGVKESTLLGEFELAQNAFFTDPSDQSAWFYHRWLLGRGERSLAIDRVHVSREESRIVLLLSRSVRVGKTVSIHLLMNDSNVSPSFHPANGSNYSSLWVGVFKLDGIALRQSIDIKISLKKRDEEVSKCELSLASNETEQRWDRNHLPGTLFRNELSAVASSTLSQELEACQQLHDMEPDNKWVLLTIVELMRSVDYIKYHEEIFLYLDKLIAVDPMRTNYYKDFKSKCKVEHILDTLPSSSSTADLSHQALTCIPHASHCATMETIDLSDNCLESVSDWHMMQCAKKLDLKNNKLKSCSGIMNIPLLEELNLENNCIESVEALQALSGCKSLRVLTLRGNPVCNAADVQHLVQASIPHLKEILV